MAESSDKLICSICLNDFKQPKLIDCQHTFCFTCLEDYIKRVSTCNRFPCPLCRQFVKVPEGGVGEFPASTDRGEMLICINGIPPCDVCKTGVKSKFRCQDCRKHLCSSCKDTHDSFKGCRNHVVVNIDSVTVNPSSDQRSKDRCTNHQGREARCYCKDCSIAVCSDCFVTNHSSHKFIDLKDEGIVNQFREELESLKGGLGDRICEFKKYCESIEIVITDINNSAKTSCETVDKQVEQTCCEIKDLGKELKGQIEKSRAEETEKLLQILGEMKTAIGDLKTSVKCSANVLTDKSVVQVINRIPRVQEDKEESCLRKLDMPDVKYTYFEKGVIDKTILLKQLGAVEILETPTLTSSFNLTELERQNGNYVYGNDYSINGQAWYLGVNKLRKDNNSTLGVYLFWRMVNNTKCTVHFEFTLFNTTGANKVHSNTSSAYSQQWPAWGVGMLIDWNMLADKQNGFLDQNNNFRIKATVKVTKVEFC
ncbi:hypothetical protein SNE40_008328 [Patella caerulea]|uniref:Uncharacterized protein n=1 Tax=Patella caerulea TaxID=87958 RepID=A0AAN8K5E2_PATCE